MTTTPDALLYTPEALADALHLAPLFDTILSHVPLFDELGQVIGDACAGGCVDGCPVRELGRPAASFPAFRYEAKAPGHERPSVVDESGNTVQHPTVKPLSMIRWLSRLVTRPGGRILEPFAGSGTGVEAAIVEGFECVAIELGAEHLPLIEQRVRKDHQQTLFGDL